MGAPSGVAWEIAYQCDSNCESCSSLQLSQSIKPLNLENVCKAAENIGRSGVLNVTLSGGEPLLYPHLFEVIKVLRSYGVAVHISTNGGRLREMASDLVALGVSSVTVSLRCLDGPRHDQYYQNFGLYDAMCEGIEKFRVEAMGKAMTRLRFLVTADNYFEMPQVVAKWKEKVDEVCFQPVQDLGPGHVHQPSDPSLLFSPHQRDDFRLVMKELMGRFGAFNTKYNRNMEQAIFAPEQIHKQFTCLVPAFFCKALPNGDIVSCADHLTTQGNLLHEPLVDIWNNSAFQGLRHRCRHRERECACWIQPLQVSFLLPSWAEYLLRLRRSFDVKSA